MRRVSASFGFASSYRLKPLRTAQHWRRLAQHWRILLIERGRWTNSLGSGKASAITALGDVKRATAGHAKIGAFILAAHLIDTLALLSTTRGDGKAAWDQFVPAFLPAYSGAAEELYRSHRGSLSHRYSLKASV
jgi:hypothetical protein